MSTDPNQAKRRAESEKEAVGAEERAALESDQDRERREVELHERERREREEFRAREQDRERERERDRERLRNTERESDRARDRDRPREGGRSRRTAQLKSVKGDLGGLAYATTRAGVDTFVGTTRVIGRLAGNLLESFFPGGPGWGPRRDYDRDTGYRSSSRSSGGRDRDAARDLRDAVRDVADVVSDSAEEFSRHFERARYSDDDPDDASRYRDSRDDWERDRDRERGRM
jgi:hypothetical protein